MEELPVKKTSILALTLMVGLLLVFSYLFVLADDIKEGSASSGCPAVKATAAEKASATESRAAEPAKSSAGCPFAKKAEAKGCAMSASCSHNSKCADVNLSIKGMTCTGCEETITKALQADKGIIKVVSIDYKTGKATVCYDPAKLEPNKVVSLVTGAGYKAEIIPANATAKKPGKGAVCDFMTGKCGPTDAKKTTDESTSH